MDERLLKNVKYYRERANLTPEELSKRIGKKEDYIKRFEDGKLSKYPTLELLSCISKELNIEIKKLFKYGE